MSEYTPEEMRDGVYAAQRVIDKMVVYFADYDGQRPFSDAYESLQKLDEAGLRALLHIGKTCAKVALKEALRRGLDLGVVFG